MAKPDNCGNCGRPRDEHRRITHGYDLTATYVCPESTYAERSEPAAASVPLLIDPIYFMGKMLEGLASGDADKSLAYARHYIEQLEAAGSTSQAKRLRDAMDGTARMVGLAAPAGAHCNDCTDPHCHGSALAVSREASVPQGGEWPTPFTVEQLRVYAALRLSLRCEQTNGQERDWSDTSIILARQLLALSEVT
jgi:hypothetical protein